MWHFRIVSVSMEDSRWFSCDPKMDEIRRWMRSLIVGWNQASDEIRIWMRLGYRWGQDLGFDVIVFGLSANCKGNKLCFAVNDATQTLATNTLNVMYVFSFQFVPEWKSMAFQLQNFNQIPVSKRKIQKSVSLHKFQVEIFEKHVDVGAYGQTDLCILDWVLGIIR